jgi:hypothetical protein
MPGLREPTGPSGQGLNPSRVMHVSGAGQAYRRITGVCRLNCAAEYPFERSLPAMGY